METEFNNQNDPNTFFSVSSQESQPGPTTDRIIKIKQLETGTEGQRLKTIQQLVADWSGGRDSLHLGADKFYASTSDGATGPTKTEFGSEMTSAICAHSSSITPYGNP